jgi:hypothetical protein
MQREIFNDQLSIKMNLQRLETQGFSDYSIDGKA